MRSLLFPTLLAVACGSEPQIPEPIPVAPLRQEAAEQVSSTLSMTVEGWVEYRDKKVDRDGKVSGVVGLAIPPIPGSTLAYKLLKDERNWVLPSGELVVQVGCQNRNEGLTGDHTEKIGSAAWFALVDTSSTARKKFDITVPTTPADPEEKPKKCSSFLLSMELAQANGTKE